MEGFTKKYRLLATLSWIVSLLSIGVLWVSMYIGRTKGHLPKWLTFPSPSYLGVMSPERYASIVCLLFPFHVLFWTYSAMFDSVLRYPCCLAAVVACRELYGVGFAVVVLLGLAIVVPFIKFLQSRVEREFQYLIRGAMLVSFAGFLALFLHAVVPMQGDTYTLLDAGQPLTQKNMKFQSILHQGGAAVFLIASWLYITLVLYIYRCAALCVCAHSGPTVCPRTPSGTPLACSHSTRKRGGG
jgi:hypothetical protein